MLFKPMTNTIIDIICKGNTVPINFSPKNKGMNTGDIQIIPMAIGTAKNDTKEKDLFTNLLILSQSPEALKNDNLGTIISDKLVTTAKNARDKWLA